MKNILCVSLIVAATFASVGLASADTIYTDGYTGWAASAFSANSDS